MAPEPIDKLTHAVLAASFEVHSVLGPGLLETIYERCLTRELALRGIACVCQRSVPVLYKSEPVGADLRLDLLVEDAVIVEVKAVREITPVHRAQLLTYLKLTGLTVGLVLNFNVPHLRDGICRVVNGFQ